MIAEDHLQDLLLLLLLLLHILVLRVRFEATRAN